MATSNLPGTDAARHGTGDADLTIMLAAHAAFRRDLVRLAHSTTALVGAIRRVTPLSKRAGKPSSASSTCTTPRKTRSSGPRSVSAWTTATTPSPSSTPWRKNTSS